MMLVQDPQKSEIKCKIIFFVQTKFLEHEIRIVRKTLHY